MDDGNCWSACRLGQKPGLGTAFLAFAWQGTNGERLLAVVNYAPNQSQCYVCLPFADLADKQWQLQDQLGNAVCDRDGTDLQTRGLYMDAAPWHRSVSSLKPAS